MPLKRPQPKRPAKKRTGRPPGSSPLLNAELTAAICKELAIGVPLKYAAEQNGISEMTALHWMEKGAEGIHPYEIFREAVTRARALAVGRLTRLTLSGGKGSSNAAWVLERRYPKDYGSRQRLEVTGNDGSPIEHDIRIDPVNDAAARALLEAALGRSAKP